MAKTITATILMLTILNAGNIYTSYGGISKPKEEYEPVTYTQYGYRQYGSDGSTAVRYGDRTYISSPSTTGTWVDSNTMHWKSGR